MSNIKKLCGFCINEWHLTTMVLPYISKEINNNYKIIENREKAIFEALHLAKENDTVLILGKGLDNYMAISDKYVKYSDLNVIKSYFKKLSKEKW